MDTYQMIESQMKEALGQWFGGNLAKALDGCLRDGTANTGIKIGFGYDQNGKLTAEVTVSHL